MTERTDSSPAKPEAQRSAQQRVSFSQRFWKIWDRGGIFIILGVFAIVLALLTPRFLTPQNLINLVRQVSVLTLMSMALLTVVITGNIDLTVGAFAGLIGALIAGFSIALGFFPALMLVALIAIFVGLTNGFLTTRGKNLSVIVTLAMMTIIQGVTLLYTESRPITGFSEAIVALGSGYIGPIPVPVIIAVLVALLIHFMLNHTRFGRELFAIGGNPEAARLSGIPVKLRIIHAFVISAMLSATAGIVLTGRVASAQPNAGVGDELDAVGAVLIGGASLSGGKGTVLGTLAGVLILGMISNGLNLLRINPFYQYVIKGLIILFAILMDQWERD
jgi:ribose transport system permease protein